MTERIIYVVLGWWVVWLCSLALFVVWLIGGFNMSLSDLATKNDPLKPLAIAGAIVSLGVLVIAISIAMRVGKVGKIVVSLFVLGILLVSVVSVRNLHHRYQQSIQATSVWMDLRS